MTARLPDHLDLIATAPDGIRKLRGLILELAVRGKLVPQDANDEPASELLKRVTAERAALATKGGGKSLKHLPAVANDEQPFTLPARWEWTRLGELVLKSGAGWSPSCESRPRQGNEWGVLKVSAVSWGEFKPDENKALPENLAPRPEHEVALGDFLISRANTAELVARSVVVESCPDRLMLSDKIVRLKLSQFVDGRFINITNSCAQARDYYARVAGGTSSSMKNVSREQILNLVVPLPPLAEQHRIVAKVDELMALCDRMEAEQADAETAHARLVETLLGTLTQSADADELAANWQRLAEHFESLFATEASIEALRQSAFQLAVTGRLVPQDSNDEPASDLLECISNRGVIRTQRESTPGDFDLGKLPRGWTYAAIDAFCEVQGGIQKTPLRRPVSHHFPYLRVANVQRNSITVDSLERFELTSSELERWQLRKDDLLIVEGNGSETEIGRCAVWNGQVPQCVYQNHLIRIRPANLGVVPYLQLFLNSPVGKNIMKSLAITTSGLYNLSVGKIRSIGVFLPLSPSNTASSPKSTNSWPSATA